jgi:TrmH family RNA methyltransferase
VKKIDSPHNEVIKQIATLQTKKGRTQLQQFIAEGVRICSTLVESPLECIQLYVTENLLADAQNLLTDAFITIVSEPCLKKISTAKTPCGMVGIFAVPPSIKQKKIEPGIVLANISDPGNMGTLIRSSVAFGYPQIVVIDSVDPWNPKVVQASAGTIGFAQIVEMSWHELVNHADRPKLAALVPKKGAPLKQKDMLLAIGNEAHGLPETWINECEAKISLPMPGKIESLNASIAGSIALYIMATQ